MSYTGLVELKPCPFCGGAAQGTPSFEDGGGVMACYICCPACDVSPDACYRTASEWDQAVEAWNTRPDAIEALTRPVDVEAVKAALAKTVMSDGDWFQDMLELWGDEEETLTRLAQAALAAMEAPHADG